MIVARTTQEGIKKEFAKPHAKVVVVYGARQVGKTTMVESVLNTLPGNILRINGDRLGIHSDISSRDLTKLSAMLAGVDILFIDEAQRIPDIGVNLKILHENLPALKIIVTGSAALNLASSVKETLTGRKKQFTLYPISFLELSNASLDIHLTEQLEERLIFGAYPYMLQLASRTERIEYIMELTEDYLYKDILQLENIRYHRKLRDLLRLLAFQVGAEVSFSELASNLSLSKETVARYIDLLAQAFVLLPLGGLSRNLRKEVNKKPKIYFYDLGVRNAVIGNFNGLDARNDIGALWENFLIMERLKRNAYLGHHCSTYFWRTYTGAELDYVEEYAGTLDGYEFKYQKPRKAPKAWLTTYAAEGASFACITRDNFLSFVK